MVVEELHDVLSTRNFQGRAMPYPPQVSGVLNCVTQSQPLHTGTMRAPVTQKIRELSHD